MLGYNQLNIGKPIAFLDSDEAIYLENIMILLFFNMMAGAIVYMFASWLFSIELTWSLIGFVVVTQIGCSIVDAFFAERK